MRIAKSSARATIQFRLPPPRMRRHRRLRCDAFTGQHTFARYDAERRRNESMVKNNKVFFHPWETIHESNPQEILEREEKVSLVPFLIMQGALDDNVLPEVQEKFVKTYRAAGGDCDYRLFENSVHEWVAEPGPQTDKAVEVVKEFVARQLKV
jgi:alpha-beta hydrolase superfamily lysophospholipase